MNLNEYKKYDESARDLEESVRGRLVLFGYFCLAVVICLTISVCSHG